MAPIFDQDWACRLGRGSLRGQVKKSRTGQPAQLGRHFDTKRSSIFNRGRLRIIKML